MRVRSAPFVRVHFSKSDLLSPDTPDFSSFAAKQLKKAFNWHFCSLERKTSAQSYVDFHKLLVLLSGDGHHEHELNPANYKTRLASACQQSTDGVHFKVKLPAVPPSPANIVRFTLSVSVCASAPTSVDEAIVDVCTFGFHLSPSEKFQAIRRQWNVACGLPEDFNGPYSHHASNLEISSHSDMAELLQHIDQFGKHFVIRVGQGVPKKQFSFTEIIVPDGKIMEGSHVADGPVPTSFVLPGEAIDNSISAFSSRCSCEQDAPCHHTPKFIRHMFCFPDYQAGSPEAQIAFIDNAIGMSYPVLKRFLTVKGTEEVQKTRMHAMESAASLLPFLADNMFNWYGYGAKNAIGKMCNTWHVFSCCQGELHHAKIMPTKNFERQIKVYAPDSKNQKTSFSNFLETSGFHPKIAEHLLLCAEHLPHFTVLVLTDLKEAILAPMASKDGFKKFIQQLRDTYTFALGLYTPALQGNPKAHPPGKSEHLATATAASTSQQAGRNPGTPGASTSRQPVSGPSPPPEMPLVYVELCQLSAESYRRGSRRSSGCISGSAAMQKLTGPPTTASAWNLLNAHPWKGWPQPPNSDQSEEDISMVQVEGMVEQLLRISRNSVVESSLNGGEAPTPKPFRQNLSDKLTFKSPSNPAVKCYEAVENAFAVVLSQNVLKKGSAQKVLGPLGNIKVVTLALPYQDEKALKDQVDLPEDCNALAFVRGKQVAYARLKIKLPYFKNYDTPKQFKRLFHFIFLSRKDLLTETGEQFATSQALQERLEAIHADPRHWTLTPVDICGGSWTSLPATERASRLMQLPLGEKQQQSNKNGLGILTDAACQWAETIEKSCDANYHLIGRLDQPPVQFQAFPDAEFDLYRGIEVTRTRQDSKIEKGDIIVIPLQDFPLINERTGVKFTKIAVGSCYSRKHKNSKVRNAQIKGEATSMVAIVEAVARGRRVGGGTTPDLLLVKRFPPELYPRQQHSGCYLVQMGVNLHGIRRWNEVDECNMINGALSQLCKHVGEAVGMLPVEVKVRRPELICLDTLGDVDEDKEIWAGARRRGMVQLRVDNLPEHLPLIRVGLSTGYKTSPTSDQFLPCKLWAATTPSDLTEKGRWIAQAVFKKPNGQLWQDRGHSRFFSNPIDNTGFCTFNVIPVPRDVGEYDIEVSVGLRISNEIPFEPVCATLTACSLLPRLIFRQPAFLQIQPGRPASIQVLEVQQDLALGKTFSITACLLDANNHRCAERISMAPKVTTADQTVLPGGEFDTKIMCNWQAGATDFTIHVFNFNPAVSQIRDKIRAGKLDVPDCTLQISATKVDLSCDLGTLSFVTGQPQKLQLLDSSGRQVSGSSSGVQIAGEDFHILNHQAVPKMTVQLLTTNGLPATFQALHSAELVLKWGTQELKKERVAWDPDGQATFEGIAVHISEFPSGATDLSEAVELIIRVIQNGRRGVLAAPGLKFQTVLRVQPDDAPKTLVIKQVVGPVVSAMEAISIEEDNMRGEDGNLDNMLARSGFMEETRCTEEVKELGQVEADAQRVVIPIRCRYGGVVAPIWLEVRDEAERAIKVAGELELAASAGTLTLSKRSEFDDYIMCIDGFKTRLSQSQHPRPIYRTEFKMSGRTFAVEFEVQYCRWVLQRVVQPPTTTTAGTRRTPGRTTDGSRAGSSGSNRASSSGGAAAAAAAAGDVEDITCVCGNELCEVVKVVCVDSKGEVVHGAALQEERESGRLAPPPRQMLLAVCARHRKRGGSVWLERGKEVGEPSGELRVQEESGWMKFDEESGEVRFVEGLRLMARIPAPRGREREVLNLQATAPHLSEPGSLVVRPGRKDVFHALPSAATGGFTTLLRTPTLTGIFGDCGCNPNLDPAVQHVDMRLMLESRVIHSSPSAPFVAQPDGKITMNGAPIRLAASGRYTLQYKFKLQGGGVVTHQGSDLNVSAAPVVTAHSLTWDPQQQQGQQQQDGARSPQNGAQASPAAGLRFTAGQAALAAALEGGGGGAAASPAGGDAAAGSSTGQYGQALELPRFSIKLQDDTHLPAARFPQLTARMTCKQLQSGTPLPPPITLEVVPAQVEGPPHQGLEGGMQSLQTGGNLASTSPRQMHDGGNAQREAENESTSRGSGGLDGIPLPTPAANLEIAQAQTEGPTEGWEGGGIVDGLLPSSGPPPPPWELDAQGDGILGSTVGSQGVQPGQLYGPPPPVLQVVWLRCELTKEAADQLQQAGKYQLELSYQEESEEVRPVPPTHHTFRPLPITIVPDSPTNIMLTSDSYAADNLHDRKLKARNSAPPTPSTCVEAVLVDEWGNRCTASDVLQGCLVQCSVVRLDGHMVEPGTAEGAGSREQEGGGQQLDHHSSWLQLSGLDGPHEGRAGESERRRKQPRTSGVTATGPTGSGEGGGQESGGQEGEGRSYVVIGDMLEGTTQVPLGASGRVGFDVRVKPGFGVGDDQLSGNGAHLLLQICMLSRVGGAGGGAGSTSGGCRAAVGGGLAQGVNFVCRRPFHFCDAAGPHGRKNELIKKRQVAEAAAREVHQRLLVAQAAKKTKGEQQHKKVQEVQQLIAKLPGNISQQIAPITATSAADELQAKVQLIETKIQQLEVDSSEVRTLRYPPETSLSPRQFQELGRLSQQPGLKILGLAASLVYMDDNEPWVVTPLTDQGGPSTAGASGGHPAGAAAGDLERHEAGTSRGPHHGAPDTAPQLQDCEKVMRAICYTLHARLSKIIVEGDASVKAVLGCGALRSLPTQDLKATEVRAPVRVETLPTGYNTRPGFYCRRVVDVLKTTTEACRMSRLVQGTLVPFLAGDFLVVRNWEDALLVVQHYRQLQRQKVVRFLPRILSVEDGNVFEAGGTSGAKFLPPVLDDLRVRFGMRSWRGVERIRTSRHLLVELNQLKGRILGMKGCVEGLVEVEEGVRNLLEEKRQSVATVKAAEEALVKEEEMLARLQAMSAARWGEGRHTRGRAKREQRGQGQQVAGVPPLAAASLPVNRNFASNSSSPQVQKLKQGGKMDVSVPNKRKATVAVEEPAPKLRRRSIETTLQMSTVLVMDKQTLMYMGLELSVGTRNRRVVTVVEYDKTFLIAGNREQVWIDGIDPEGMVSFQSVGGEEELHKIHLDQLEGMKRSGRLVAVPKGP